MTTPPAEVPARADGSGRPWSDYVRSVTIEDRGLPEPHQPPIHVASRVSFDGAPAPHVVRLPIAVDASPDGGTVLTMHFYAEDVTFGIEDPYAWAIGGRPVLVPDRNSKWAWEVVTTNEANPDLDVVACPIYVAEIHFK